MDPLKQARRKESDRPSAVLISPRDALRKPVIDELAVRARVLDCTEAGRYPSAATILEHKPDLCFIDVGSSEEALTLVRELASSHVPVAALHLNNDSDLILRSFRCGASEFLSPPILRADLLDVFERLLTKSAPGPAINRPGKIWTVMPAKPSYGATTICCNLAVRFRKALERPILLADMDPLLGSIGFALKLKSAFSFTDVVNQGSPIDKDLWRKIIVPYEEADVLLGPDVPQFEIPASTGIPSFLQFVRANYGAVVLDTRGPLSHWDLSLARSADELLLITTNELSAVHATLRAIQLLENAGTERSRIRLIVNRYEKDNGLLKEAIESALKLDVYCTLPNDYAPVQKSVLDGKTISSNCKFGASMDDLVQRLTGLMRSTRKKPSLLSTIFARSRV